MEQDTEMKEEEDTYSNSPESSSDEEAEDEKLTEIKDQLENHPYSYELHVQLITLYRKSGDLDQLRAAREKMNKLFPLTPELWLDWLTDEKTLATTQEQKENLTSLFERAINDYASVSVWLEYVQFTIGKMGDIWEENGLEAIRQTFERSITAVGIHVTQGCLLWEAYREFETVYLLHLKNKGASDEEMKQQEERIFNIFKRQLSVPLLDMDKTYEEFKELYSDSQLFDIKSIDYSYKKALKKLDEVQVYEDALYKSESPHYEEYKAYIQYEKEKGDPSRVQNLYERSVIENCLKEELWLDYTKYLDKVIKIRDVSLPVHERAVKNLPWCANLWVRYVRSMESYQEPHDKVVEVFQTALLSGFSKAEDFKELWLAYLDYLRRRIKDEDLEAGTREFKEIENVFDKATIQMSHYYWGSESEYVIMKYWIFFTAKYKKDIENARSYWKELIEHGHREEARAWLDFANFEKLYGDSTHYRKCLLQALSCVSDWPETFLDLLITFEREEGTLESLEKSLQKCETLMQQINQKRLKKLEEAENVEEKKKFWDKKNTRNSSKHHPKFSKSESPNKGESDSPVQMDSEGFKIPPIPGKLHSPESNSKPDSHSDIESSKRKKYSDETDQPESKKRKVESSESHGVSVAHDSSKDDRTVFVSNLSYKVEEDKIKEYFAQIGELEDVRLVKDFKGRSKGFCYVLYKNQPDAKKALSKDREPLDGRPMFISSCEDKKNNPSFQSKFKFGTGLERNKLFIKNLPFSTTKEDLETMFKEYGCVKDVRIVTYRNGHSKGLAYVEFSNEVSATNAMVKTDGSQVKDNIISVAISNPPPRKPKKEFSSASISDSLGGGGGLPKGPRGRGRTQLTLVPRSVVRKPANKKNSFHSNNSIQNGQNSSSTSEEQKPLSNSDFAKMLKK